MSKFFFVFAGTVGSIAVYGIITSSGR